jgi:polar amino acid transport system substrate-binding protein
MTRMINCLTFFLPLWITLVANASPLKVVTSDFPPYQIINDEKVEGLASEIVVEVIKNAGLTGNFRSYPWPRAYKIAQNEKDVLIYSIVRSPEREKRFKWIGNIAPFDVHFWRLSKRSDIKINTVEDAKRYIIGGVNNDIKATYLESKGFTVGKNLTLVNSDELNLKMLMAKRIDVLPADEFSFYYRLKIAHYEAADFTKLIKLKGIPDELYLAASLTTSDEIVNKLKKSLYDLQKTKQFKELQKKFKTH